MTALIAIATLLLCVPIPQSEQQQSNDESALTTEPQSRETIPPVAVNGSTAQVNSTADKKQTTAQEQSQTQERDLIITAYYISGPLALIISFATGILVWRQIRALRTIERAQIDLDLAVNHYTYTVLLSNHGKSIGIITAYRFSHASHAIDASKLSVETAVKIFEDEWPMYAMLPPGINQREWHTHDLRTSLGEQTLKEADQQIIDRGEVEYRDIFGKMHETEVVYRYRLSPPELKPIWEYGKFT
jgi:hypothetical protein